MSQVANSISEDIHKKSENTKGLSEKGNKKKPGPAISEKSAWLIYACAALFYLYEYALRVSPSIMTNELMVDLGVTSTALGVLSAFYYYAYVPLQIPCGIIVDWLGPRRVVTFSAALCVAGCILFSQSQSLYLIQIGRFIMGAGSACAYLSCLKISAEWFPPQRFAMIAGVTMMMGTFGGIFGGFPFAIMVNNFGWRTAMLIAGLIGIGIMFTSWFIIKDRDDHLISPTHKPNHPDLTLMDGLKIVASNRQVWLVGIYGFFMYVPLSGFAELWGVPFLMEIYHIDKDLASKAASATLFIGMGIGCPIGAWLSNVIKSHLKVMSLAALGALVVFVIVIYVPNIPFWAAAALIFIAGLFCGGQILYFAVARESTPSHLAGTVVGFTNGLLMTSGMVYQPILGYFLDLAWDGQTAADGVTRLYNQQAYQWAMLSIPIGLFAAWIILKFLRETYQDLRTTKA